MSKLAGIFILGILAGWVMEWVFVRLFVPNPKKKLETALQASRKENDTLQKQNSELKAALTTAQADHSKQVTSPAVETTETQSLTKSTTEQIAVVEPQAAETEVSTVEPLPPLGDVGKQDDLTKLNGIGPKLAEAMNAAGIMSYSQLAELSVGVLSERLASSGIRYSKASAESWAAQAVLADKNDWDGLKNYQSALKS